MASLRRAVHGWWFGNPLMEIASGADITSYALELAEQGATPGSAIIQLRVDDATPMLRLALLLPPVAEAEALTLAATQGLAELASSRFNVNAAVARPGVVRLGAGESGAHVALREATRVSILTVDLPYRDLGAASEPAAALRLGEALLAAWLRHLNLAYHDLSPQPS